VSGCNVHVVGDSSAALVLAYAAEIGITITGSQTLNCGFSAMNGNRVAPAGSAGYAVCLIDWSAAPDDSEDVIFAFVSIHDGMCSTIDGCLPVDATPYTDVHKDLIATGHPVVWVEVPPIGDLAFSTRLLELNADVAAKLGCTLAPYSIREAPMWDGIHYLKSGGLLVGARLVALALDPPICP
jgi:hypothetical protein